MDLEEVPDAEILPLDERDAQSSRRGVEGGADAGGPAADDEHVELLARAERPHLLATRRQRSVGIRPRRARQGRGRLAEAHGADADRGGGGGDGRAAHQETARRGRHVEPTIRSTR